MKLKLNWLTRLLLPIAVKVVAAVVREVTPQLRAELVRFIGQWEHKARASDNEWDDMAVWVLQRILGLPSR